MWRLLGSSVMWMTHGQWQSAAAPTTSNTHGKCAEIPLASGKKPGFCPSKDVDVAAVERCLRAKQRAQHFEDWILLPQLLDAVPPGTPGAFVELGAFDGERLSNTYLLEACFNWTGLLIEAQPTNAQKLLASGRKAVKRHSAVCDPPGTVLMTPKGGDVAGQVGAMSTSYLRNWGRMNGMHTEVGRVRSNSSMLPVPCSPLRSLMADAGFLTGGAHFLSLDVEGAEEIVIRTVDPARFQVIMIEMDGHDPQKDARVAGYVTRAGLRTARGKNHIGGSEVFYRGGMAMHEDEDDWQALELQLQRCQHKGRLAHLHKEFMFQRALCAALRWHRKKRSQELRARSDRP